MIFLARPSTPTALRVAAKNRVSGNETLSNLAITCSYMTAVSGKVDAQLAHSMDGRHWLRGVRDPLFANGPPGSPTAGLVYPNSALLPSGAQPTAFER